VAIQIKQLKELIPSPDATSTEPWEVSIAELVRKTGKVPKLATKALGLFDRFGAVRITPDEIGFDGEEVPWDKVVELRTHGVANLLTGQALEREVDRIRGYLPPVPGRKWVVDKVVNLSLDLTMAVAGDQLRQAADVAEGINADEAGPNPDPDAQNVVAEIVYKGMMRRTKELSCGLFAASVMIANRDVSRALRQGAAMRGIPVVASDEEHFDEAHERGQALRERFGVLERKARQMRETMATITGDGADDDLDDSDDVVAEAPDGDAPGRPETSPGVGAAS
jgi:hypothetical protein